MGRFQLSGGVPRWTTSLLQSVGGSSRVRQAVGWIRPLRFGRSAAGHPPDRSPSILNGDLRPLRRRVTGGVEEGPQNLQLKGHLQTFRHNFISTALLGRTPEAVVCDWVGHVDPEILKLYTHIRQEQSRQFMDRLSGGGRPPPPVLEEEIVMMSAMSIQHTVRKSRKIKNEKAATISQ